MYIPLVYKASSTISGETLLRNRNCFFECLDSVVRGPEHDYRDYPSGKFIFFKSTL